MSPVGKRNMRAWIREIESTTVTELQDLPMKISLTSLLTFLCSVCSVCLWVGGIIAYIIFSVLGSKLSFVYQWCMRQEKCFLWTALSMVQLGDTVGTALLGLKAKSWLVNMPIHLIANVCVCVFFVNLRENYFLAPEIQLSKE